MRTRFAFMLALGLALLVLAAACGGDGDGGGRESAIRTQKGLNLAALVAQTGGQEETGAGPAPGAPAARTDIAKGGAGVAPEFAPFPFFSLQEGQTGITVQGYGSAAADADSAIVELYFGPKFTGIEPQPLPRGETGAEGGAAPSGAPETQLQPISEADLQPVIDAIVSQGVSRDDIEVLITSYDPTYSSATIRVTVRNVDSLQGIVDAATNAAAALEAFGLQGTSVTYTVSDCAALERAAMQAAVEDARERGGAFAEALGVGLGAVVGASNYSYSPFGGAPCGGGFSGPYALGGVAYAQGQPSEVQVIANVSVTFAIQ